MTSISLPVQADLTRLRRRQPSLQLAPLHLRVMASVINAAIAIVALAVAIGAGAGAFFIARRIRGAAEDEPPQPRGEGRTVHLSDADDQGRGENPLAAKLHSSKARLPLALGSVAVAVLLDGRQSPGARALGLRVVDARSGEKISRRQAVVRVAAGRLWQVMMQRVFRLPKIPPLTGDEGLRSEMEAVRRQFADDQEALQAAVMRVYQEHKVRVSCLPIYLQLLLTALIHAPAWSPLKQGLPDRLAGTVVVVDRHARHRRSSPRRIMRRRKAAARRRTRATSIRRWWRLFA